MRMGRHGFHTCVSLLLAWVSHLCVAIIGMGFTLVCGYYWHGFSHVCVAFIGTGFHTCVWLALGCAGFGLGEGWGWWASG